MPDIDLVRTHTDTSPAVTCHGWSVRSGTCCPRCCSNLIEWCDTFKSLCVCYYKASSTDPVSIAIICLLFWHNIESVTIYHTVLSSATEWMARVLRFVYAILNVFIGGNIVYRTIGVPEPVLVKPKCAVLIIISFGVSVTRINRYREFFRFYSASIHAIKPSCHAYRFCVFFKFRVTFQNALPFSLFGGSVYFICRQRCAECLCCQVIAFVLFHVRGCH